MIRFRRRRSDIEAALTGGLAKRRAGLELTDGARVAVIGGGPAGSFFAYFVLRMAATVNLQVNVEIYEPRFFTHSGPAGCNHCGGIVSESLVQLLAAEGINLPPEMVQRGIDSYVLHTDVGSVRIAAPRLEKRIAALYRGNGPRASEPLSVYGFDRFLGDLAASQGATVRRQLVTGVDWEGGRPTLVTARGQRETYDLVAVAAGVNSHLVDSVAAQRPTYRAPAASKTFICEFRLGWETIERCLGASMHVFLLDLPRLEFAALIPKGNFVTLALLGEEIDEELVERFLGAPEVRACFPGARIPANVCHCFPRINVRAPRRPFADRMVMIGDCGVARLYKDGIGSAYRTAKAAARTAVYQGISGETFRAHFWPACRAIDVDNRLGRLVFGVSGLIQKFRFSRQALVRMTAREQARAGSGRHMSSVMWDVFTGSAPYREILVRTLHPAFISSLLWNLVAANVSLRRARRLEGHGMSNGTLGKSYRDGEAIVREGEIGDCMFVVQQGQVEVVTERDGECVRVGVLGPGDFFGEMAIVEKQTRSATVRAVGEARILTVDQRTFFRRVQEDPSLAFNILRTLCHRVRMLDREVTELRNQRLGGPA